MQTEDTEPTPSAAQRAMEHHARARRYVVGDTIWVDARLWTVSSVAVVTNWHVVLRLVGDDGIVLTVELDPDDDIVRRSDGAGAQLSLV